MNLSLTQAGDLTFFLILKQCVKMLVVYQAAYQTVEQEVVHMLFELAIQSDDFQPEKYKVRMTF